MNKYVKLAQKGFTLIELVVVLVILGILAAVAVPRYLDLSASATTAALQGTSGAIESSAAINYAKAAADSYQNVDGTAGHAAPVANGGDCVTVVNSILTAPIDTSKYTVAGTISGITAPGQEVTNCTIVPAGSSATPTTLHLISTGS